MSLLSSRSKAVLIAVAIFVLGMLFGSTLERWMGYAAMGPVGPGFTRWGGPPPGGKGGPRGHQRILHRFSRELDLTENQKQKMRAILDESRERMRDVRRQVEQTMKPVLEESKSRIREILTSEQQEKYDRIREEMDRRMRRGRRQQRGPGGP